MDRAIPFEPGNLSGVKRKPPAGSAILNERRGVAGSLGEQVQTRAPCFALGER